MQRRTGQNRRALRPVLKETGGRTTGPKSRGLYEGAHEMTQALFVTGTIEGVALPLPNGSTELARLLKSDEVVSHPGLLLAGPRDAGETPGIWQKVSPSDSAPIPSTDSAIAKPFADVPLPL